MFLPLKNIVPVKDIRKNLPVLREIEEARKFRRADAAMAMSLEVYCSWHLWRRRAVVGKSMTSALKQNSEEIFVWSCYLNYWYPSSLALRLWLLSLSLDLLNGLISVRVPLSLCLPTGGNWSRTSERIIVVHKRRQSISTADLHLAQGKGYSANRQITLAFFASKEKYESAQKSYLLHNSNFSPAGLSGTSLSAGVWRESKILGSTLLLWLEGGRLRVN